MKRNRNGISLFLKRKIAFFETENHWPYAAHCEWCLHSGWDCAKYLYVYYLQFINLTHPIKGQIIGRDRSITLVKQSPDSFWMVAKVVGQCPSQWHAHVTKQLSSNHSGLWAIIWVWLRSGNSLVWKDTEDGKGKGGCETKRRMGNEKAKNNTQPTVYFLYFLNVYCTSCLKLGLCLGWKEQWICCVTREGGRERGREGGR